MTDIYDIISDGYLKSEFDKLINVPSLRRVLYHKMEELKAMHQPAIDTVNNIIEMADYSLKVKKSYDFTLDISNGLLHPVITNCRNKNPYTVIEKAVFQHIKDNASDIIKMENGLKFPGDNNKTIDIIYGKENDEPNLIKGQITIKYENAAQFGVDITTEEISGIHQLLRVMIEYPAIREYFLSELKLKCIPLVNSASIFNAM
jgi:hypothetical protein